MVTVWRDSASTTPVEVARRTLNVALEKSAWMMNAGLDAGITATALQGPVQQMIARGATMITFYLVRTMSPPSIVRQVAKIQPTACLGLNSATFFTSALMIL